MSISVSFSKETKSYLNFMDIEYPFTSETLKSKFKLLAKKYHPDVNNGDDKDFKFLNNANINLQKIALTDIDSKDLIGIVPISQTTHEEIHNSPDKIICDDCNGSGGVKTYNECYYCDGGRIPCEVCSATGIYWNRRQCPRCKHRIRFEWHEDIVNPRHCNHCNFIEKPKKCNSCDGTGKIGCRMCKGTGTEEDKSICMKCTGKGWFVPFNPVFKKRSLG